MSGKCVHCGYSHGSIAHKMICDRRLHVGEFNKQIVYCPGGKSYEL